MELRRGSSSTDHQVQLLNVLVQMPLQSRSRVEKFMTDSAGEDLGVAQVQVHPQLVLQCKNLLAH